MTLPAPRHRSALALSTVFGLGLMRPFPGTWGSLPPVLVAAALLAVGLGPQTHPTLYMGVMLAIALLFAAGCIIEGDRAEARFGGKDPSNVVADEVAGQALALVALPGFAQSSPAAAAVLLLWFFIAFRLLDIAKPWPIRAVQRVPGGWGILLDDLLAGLTVALFTLLLIALT